MRGYSKPCELKSREAFRPGAVPVGYGLPLSQFTSLREAIDGATGPVCSGSSAEAKTLFLLLRAESLKADEIIGPLRLRRVEELYDQLFPRRGGK